MQKNSCSRISDGVSSAEDSSSHVKSGGAAFRAVVERDVLHKGHVLTWYVSEEHSVVFRVGDAGVVGGGVQHWLSFAV